MNKETRFKNSLAYVLTLSLGLVILFAIMVLPFFFDGYSYNTDYGNKKEFIPIDGYGAMNLWNYGFAGVILSIVLIALFIATVAMLVVSIFGIMREHNWVEFSDSKNFSILKANKGLVVILTVLSVVALVFSIITVTTNCNVTQIGYFGFMFGMGSVVLCVANVAFLVAYIVLEVKGKINYANIGNQDKVIVVNEGVSQNTEEEIVVTEESLK